ncbi:AraC family transcriptional regulator [Sediminibacterium goheungense]|uniref:Helix-turn-helix protein n=1 Tax=Sediminibacterium goheungense TaxID=1086393 RepID=A0A4R6J1V2_9BACT|nr:helix-turn-helix domain-containing protein [Sediminibacterium goheungense]TDO29239.1 helix-turn-helix protein [Sediminibacterium goheungense]
MFSYVGLGVDLLLILLLISKKGKSLADRILLIWLIIIGCQLLLYALSLQTITIHNIHWLLGTSIPFPLLHGPMLYLYTAATTHMLPRRRYLLLFHFLPALIGILLFTPVFLLSANEKMAFIAQPANEYKTANFIRIVLLQVSGFVYVLWCLFLLRRHTTNIRQEFSYEEKINLNWLRYFIYGLAAVWIIIVCTRNDYYIFQTVVLFIVFLGYFGIRQVGIFTTARQAHHNMVIENHWQPAIAVEKGIGEDVDTSANTNAPQIQQEDDATERLPRKKYANSGVTAEMAMEIHKRLVYCMGTEKLFTEPDLSLYMLSQKIKVHPNYLSQVINEKEGKTFFEYINALRIEEFKRLVALPESKKFTIISLAYDCGFNSKSSFNKNFRKVTGLSPSDYLQSIGLEKDPDAAL